MTETHTCHHCSRNLHEKRGRIFTDYVGHKYCSSHCKRIGVFNWSLSIPGVRPMVPGAWEYAVRIVRSRDNYTCQDCGAQQTVKPAYTLFPAHHIIPIKHGGNSLPANLILLCKDCHDRRHTKLSERGHYPDQAKLGNEEKP